VVYCLDYTGSRLRSEQFTGQWGHYPVYTPKGRFIDALTFPEMTQAEIEDQNAFARGEDPTAILLSNSSATYNCHGTHITCQKG